MGAGIPDHAPFEAVTLTVAALTGLGTVGRLVLNGAIAAGAAAEGIGPKGPTCCSTALASGSMQPRHALPP